MRKKSVGRLLLFGVIISLALIALLLAACGSDQTQEAPPLELTSAPTSVPMATVAASGSTSDTTSAMSAQVVTETEIVAPVAGPIAGSEIYSGLTNLHRPDQITYPMNPPVGGDHNPAWMNCGVYTETVPAELAVHSMEHGAVWITYLPDLPADQVAILKALTKAGNFRLLNPNPGQDSPVIATAWGVQLKLPSADDPRLQEFIARYENRKDGPEFGAPCSGAYGEPEK